MEQTFPVAPMQNSSIEKDKPVIHVSESELLHLVEQGFVRIEATRVRYAMLAKLANFTGGGAAGVEDPE